MDICLIFMPYGGLQYPPMGLSLLLSSARQAGMSVKALYGNFWFAKAIGYDIYKMFAQYQRYENCLGEWTFSAACFPDFKPEHDAYLSSVLKTEMLLEIFLGEDAEGERDLRKRLFQIREETPAFIDRTARRILALKPKIVGCSSSFQQNCASLAILRRIKELEPEINTMIGGANCEAEMGLTMKRAFPWVDFVVSGEADEIFPVLCRTILDSNGNIEQEDIPPGVFSSANAEFFSEKLLSNGPSSLPVLIVEDLDALLEPDFADYFEELDKHPDISRSTVFLSIETSRGCWKGYRQPCRFCGLNGKRQHYRAKNPVKVFTELKSAREKYNLNAFMATDTILNMGYFKSLLPSLENAQNGYRLFFETSSMLTEHHMEVLARSGVRWIQPGIESLNQRILELLNKGNSSIHNIALLKFAIEQGVLLHWNILYRVPGDEDDQYEEMCTLIPLLHHLQPPDLVPVEFHRFSCYQNDPERYGLTLQPNPLYAYIYPVTDKILLNIGYLFRSTEVDESRDYSRPSYVRFKQTVLDWAKQFWGSPWVKKTSRNAPQLLVEEASHQSEITDTRPYASEPRATLRGVEHHIHNICRYPVETSTIQKRTAFKIGRPVKGGEVEDALRSLQDRRLLIQLNGKFIALATRPPQRPLPGPFPLLEKPRKATVWDWLRSLD